MSCGTKLTLRLSPQPPQEIFAALEGRVGLYTDFVTVFHCICLSRQNPVHWVGVVGDGENGNYEHFAYLNGRMVCSAAGYGSTDVALRDVLVKEAL